VHHSRNGFLTAKGLAEAAQRSLEGLEGVDMGEPQLYLDSRVSVSALSRVVYPEFPDDIIIDEQYRRFLDEGEEI